MTIAQLTPSDHARLSQAIAAAERGTAGEIYVVIARSPHEQTVLPVLWATLIALLLPWPLYLLSNLSVTAVLIAQATAFVVCATIFSHPSLRRWLIPPNLAREAVRRGAQSAFLAHGLYLTEERTGVLVYVALAERRVEIVADDTIDRLVPQTAWDDIASTVVAAARTGALADGIQAAITKAGSLLAAAFPPRLDDRNGLPNWVVEL